MADIFTRKKRSEVMSRIRSSGTKPEAVLRAVMQKAVQRRRLLFNVRDLPGCPDVVVPSLRVVVFADGCFYHGCRRHGHTPKSNTRYWKPKLDRNRRRDVTYARQLRRLGFSVWRVWEHDLKPQRASRTESRLSRRIGSRIAGQRVLGRTRRILSRGKKVPNSP